VVLDDAAFKSFVKGLDIALHSSRGNNTFVGPGGKSTKDRRRKKEAERANSLEIFGWLRVWIEYPTLIRVSAATTQKSLPATARVVLRAEVRAENTSEQGSTGTSPKGKDVTINN